MNKIILCIFICGLVSATVISFSLQRSEQITKNIVAQPFISDEDNTPIKQVYLENETTIITVDTSREFFEDGVITPGDNQTLYFKATGGGYIYENGYKNNFGFNVCVNNTLEGHLNYIDRNGGYHFKGVLIFNASLKEVEGGYLVVVYGFGEIHEQKYIFRLEAVDRGEPAVSDELHLWLYDENGLLHDYSGGVLKGGNININLQC